MMTEDQIKIAVEHKSQLKNALQKPPASRSYDDLLLLKSYIKKTEFITKHFAGIANPKQMNDICKSMVLESFQVGDTVFHQGDVGDKVYVILSGTCEVRVKYKIDLLQGNSETREKLVVTFGDGQFFGERALEFNDVRSASVLCTANTDLVSINKDTYMEILTEARKDTGSTGALSIEQLGTKENVIKTLSKVREKRNNQELEAASSFLQRRIPFFKDYNSHEMIELCRVAETVSIWRRSILFKQGQIGQAFYVILSGTVEVWVHDSTNTARTPNHSTSSNTTLDSAVKFHLNKHTDLTDGLGVKVNHLVSGEAFGERALENESSQRMASIVTGEEATELLVIAKEDYHNLVYVMQHADNMARLKLLRQTELFRTVDVVHLKVMAHFMQPHKYQIGEPLVKSGEKAIEMIIIDTGECRVETEVRQGHDRITTEALKRIKVDMPYTDAIHHTSQQLHQRYVEAQRKKAAEEEQDISVQVGNSVPFSDTTEGPIFRAGKSKLQDLVSMHTVSPTTAAAVVSKSRSTVGKRSTTGATTRGKRRPSINECKLARNDSILLSHVENLGTVDLGRIAPHSVLGSYITSTDYINQDVYHPETVVASTLVTSYNMSKHDFFNHMPADTRKALKHLIANYQKPTLHTLWENAPVVLDEELWRKQKAWEHFKYGLLHKDIYADILHSQKVLAGLHITAHSGNSQEASKGRLDRAKAKKHHEGDTRARSPSGIFATVEMINSSIASRSQVKARGLGEVVVTRDWGLTPTRIENGNNSIGGASRTSSRGTMPGYGRGSLRTTTQLHNTVASSLIRDRINASHAVTSRADLAYVPTHQSTHHYTHARTEAAEAGAVVPAEPRADSARSAAINGVDGASALLGQFGMTGTGGVGGGGEGLALGAAGNATRDAGITELAAPAGVGTGTSIEFARELLDAKSETASKALDGAGLGESVVAEKDMCDPSLLETSMMTNSSVLGALPVQSSPLVGRSPHGVATDVAAGAQPGAEGLATGTMNYPPASHQLGAALGLEIPAIAMAEQHLLQPNGSKLPPLRSNAIGKELSQPFQLVHVHRQSTLVAASKGASSGERLAGENSDATAAGQRGGETAKSNSTDAFSVSKRTVQCYFRLCGSTATNALAKEQADVLMENSYLTLFEGAANKEKELVLAWQPFKGFDSMPLDASDHFLIYCRTTPVEYAFTTPSKNLMLEAFPNLCKMQHHRFAAIVVNKMGESISGGGQVKKNHAVANATTATPAMASKKGAAARKRVATTTPPSAKDTAPSDSDEESDSEDEHTAVLNLPTFGVGSAMVGMARVPSTSSVGPKASPSWQLSSSNLASPIAASGATNGFTSSAGIGNGSAPDPVDLPGAAHAVPGATQIAMSLPSHSTAADKAQVMGAIGSPPPAYLLEFSILAEVLAVFPSRMDAIKYTVSRFGAISFEAATGYVGVGAVDFGRMDALTAASPESEEALGDNGALFTTTHGSGHTNGSLPAEFANASTGMNTMGVLPPALAGGGEGIGATRTENEPEGLRRILVRRPGAGSSQGASGANIRVLNALNNGSKLVCIVPLFTWIEVNNDTMNMLDFTRVFDKTLLDAVGAIEQDLAIAESESSLATGTYASFSSVPVIRYRGSMEDKFLEKSQDERDARMGASGMSLTGKQNANDTRVGSKSAEQLKKEEELILSFADAGLIDRKYIKKQERVIRTAAHSRVSNKRLQRLQAKNAAKATGLVAFAERNRKQNKKEDSVHKDIVDITTTCLTLFQESVKSKELINKVNHSATLVTAAQRNTANLLEYADYPMTAGGLHHKPATGAASVAASGTRIGQRDANVPGTTGIAASGSGSSALSSRRQSLASVMTTTTNASASKHSVHSNGGGRGPGGEGGGKGGDASDGPSLFDLLPPLGHPQSGTESHPDGNGTMNSTTALLDGAEQLLRPSLSAMWASAVNESASGRVATAARELQMEGDDVKIKHLQASHQERAKLIAANDALCDKEHNQFERKNRSKVKLGSNFDTNKMLDDTLDGRLSFLETLTAGTIGLKGSKSTSSLRFGSSGSGAAAESRITTEIPRAANNHSTPPPRGGSKKTAGAASLTGSQSTSALVMKLGLVNKDL